MTVSACVWLGPAKVTGPVELCLRGRVVNVELADSVAVAVEQSPYTVAAIAVQVRFYKFRASLENLLAFFQVFKL